MKKRNFLMMLGLLCFGVTANAQVIASLGFEDGEEQKYLNPDSVDKYPNWSADHINLGKDDVWDEDYTEDVHSGTYALRVANSGLSGSNSTTGNKWDRAIKMRGLEIEPATSYRVSFWVKADRQFSDGAQALTTSIKSSLSVGIENVEAPFMSQIKTSTNDAQYYYDWTDGVMLGNEWRRLSFVSYYSADSVQNYWFDEYNNNIKEINVETDANGDTLSVDTVYWGEGLTEFPKEFFLTINMYNPTTYLLDDIVIEKATMGGCYYAYNTIRVDFGYPTNIATLANNSTDPEAGTYLLPNSCVKVMNGDEELEVLTVELKSDGYMYIFLSEDLDEDAAANYSVSFTPAADCPIVYNTAKRPSMDVEGEMQVLGFENESMYYLEEVSGQVSYLFSAPQFVSSVPEDHSFELDAASLPDFRVTYNRPVVNEMAIVELRDANNNLIHDFSYDAMTASDDPNTLIVPLTLLESPLADGEYKLMLMDVTNANGGAVANTVTLTFSVGEDTSSGTVEVIYESSEFATTENGTFPKGWVSNDNGTIHEYGLNENGSVWNYNWGGVNPLNAGGGPRMMTGYSGDFDGGAIYWRSTGGNIGTLTFGAQVADHVDVNGNIEEDMDPEIGLYLEPAKYQFSFRMAAWKHDATNDTYPKYSFYLEKVDLSKPSTENELLPNMDNVVSFVEDVVAKPDVNGQQNIQVTGATLSTAEFTVTEAGYYMMKFYSDSPEGGQNNFGEYLLGSVSVVTRPSDAVYYKGQLAEAVDSANVVKTMVDNVIYDGDTKSALVAALDQAAGKFTSPSSVEAMCDTLYALCGRMLDRKANVDNYDPNMVTLVTALGQIEAGSKYTLTSEYVECEAVLNKYNGVTAQSMNDADLDVAVDEVTLYGSIASNLVSCVDALTYRLTKAATTARKIGASPESAITAAESSLTDNDDLAEGLNGHIKYRLYEILSSGSITDEMKDTIYSETEMDATTGAYKVLAAGVDLTSFVKNPEFYTYLENASDTVRSENTPGWDLMYGYVHVNGDAEGLVSDTRRVADNCLNAYMNNYKIGQSVSGLPVGKYKVHMRTRTATQTAADGTSFVMNAVNDTTGIPDKYIWAVTSDNPNDTVRVEFAAGNTVYPIHSWGGFPTVIEQEITVNENTVLTFGVVEHYKSYGNHYFKDANNNNAWTLIPDSIGGNWDTNCYADEARLIFVAPLEGYDYSAGLTGIDEVEAAAEAVKREFYTVDGIKVERPRKGVFIVKTYYADGTVKVETKVMK